MVLKGRDTIPAGAKEVWSILMDEEKLAKITPGVSSLESIGNDHYRAISDVKIGPVKGSFEGDVELHEKKEPESFVLKVRQNSKIGNVNAKVSIYLKDAEGHNTELSFEGIAKLSGLLARTGNRVVSGVANTLTRQFFEALKKEVSGESG